MRALLYIPLALLLVASIPWGFAEDSTVRLWGFPSWAIYSVAISFVYACVISAFVSRFWDKGIDDEENTGDADQ